LSARGHKDARIEKILGGISARDARGVGLDARPCKRRSCWLDCCSWPYPPAEGSRLSLGLALASWFGEQSRAGHWRRNAPLQQQRTYGRANQGQWARYHGGTRRSKAASPCSAGRRIHDRSGTYVSRRARPDEEDVAHTQLIEKG
jgi:hypothetical protein